MENLDKDLKWAMKLQRVRDRSYRKYQKMRIALENKALKMQAREYERRLDGLNHENARILAAQDKSISVEKFDGAIGQIYTKIDNTAADLRKDVIDLKEFKQKQEGKGQGGKDVLYIITIIILILGFIFANFIFKKN